MGLGESDLQAGVSNTTKKGGQKRYFGTFTDRHNKVAKYNVLIFHFL